MESAPRAKQVMKSLGAFAIALMLCLGSRTALAGSIDVGLVTESDVPNWVCGSPVRYRSADFSVACGTARFHQCAQCNTFVAVRNNSNSTIKIRLDVQGEGFYRSGSGAFGMACLNGLKHRSAMAYCNSLAPGSSCFQRFEFCPEHSGETNGRVTIRLSGGGVTAVKRYALVGGANYTEKQKAADDVRKKLASRLLKNSKVRKISLNYLKRELVIDVEVAESADIPALERVTPEELDGYKVIVTRFIPVERAL